ncbi:cytochrome P450 [Mycena sp. CBHHK59/15]|nr:cytochrome P450 [Mycena sp. CBHHK59/15]
MSTLTYATVILLLLLCILLAVFLSSHSINLALVASISLVPGLPLVGNLLQVIINTYSGVNKTLIQQGAAFQSRPEFKAMARGFLEGIRSGRPNHHWESVIPTAVDGPDERREAPECRHPFGQRFGEDVTRLVADVNIKAFRQRSLATPVHDYVPLVAAAERLALAAASPIHFLLRPLGLSSWLDSIYEAEAHAKELRDAEVGFCKELLRDLHERLDAQDPTPSQMGDIFRSITDGTLSPNEELRLATTLTGSGMSGGTGLTWLAALLAGNPGMQENAHRAIEEVYDGEVPDPLDTDRVEYIKALGMEAGRYFASIRLGFPRETHEDAVVDGVLIPKGVLVVYNSYQINRDPQRYDFPEEFIPERWMAGHYGRTDIKQPKVGVPHLNHGAGRRVCMGVPNVNKMFYANLVLLLHFFKLERAPSAMRRAPPSSPSYAPSVSACDPQALPLAAGIKLTARDPDALAHWLAEGHRELDQWDRPNLADASLPSEVVDPGIRGHY